MPHFANPITAMSSRNDERDLGSSDFSKISSKLIVDRENSFFTWVFTWVFGEMNELVVNKKMAQAITSAETANVASIMRCIVVWAVRERGRCDLR